MPVFTRLAFDEDDDVRNNAIFGMGELVLHAGPPMNPHFGKILETLSKLLVNEKSARVLDQIVGAVCRLILSNKALVPLEQVLPVVFQNVPLKEDMDEYETFFRKNTDGSKSPTQGTSHEKLQHLEVTDPNELTSMA